MAVVPIPIYSYPWIFGLTVVFGFLDAYAIGANDVANSFATSVGSRSLKLWQACCIAVFTEFIGAVALGAETTGTIKDNIINLSLFDAHQDLLMMAFMCALIGSSSFVMLATRLGWPVSTTHSIVGAIVGVGISAYGSDAVNWAWDGKGVSQIVAGWIIAPLLAGLLASIIYLFTLYVVLKAKNPLRSGIYAIPVYFTVTVFIVTFFIVSKNGKGNLMKISTTGSFGAVTVSGDVGKSMGIVGGVTGFILLFTVANVVPFFIRRLEKEEDLKWYHLFYIWAVPAQPVDAEIAAKLNATFTPHLGLDGKPIHKEVEQVAATAPAPVEEDKTVLGTVKKGFNGVVNLAKKGLLMDVANEQSAHSKDAHQHAIVYENKVEYLFSFLQVLTASFASFSHGSNDVANAVGPLAAVYQIYSTGSVGKNASVQTWMLAMGGIAIDLGLALYGWRIMINLGNNMTYHSPTRGFAMELGASLSVVTASFLGLPVSTTQCIVGATIFVGLCNGTTKAVNWKMAGVTFFSWLVTLPIAGVTAGLLFALVTRGPHF